MAVWYRTHRGVNMQRRRFLSISLANGTLGIMACSMSGCGTLMHKERVGQPHAHQIDWKVVALDGLGMLLFFVPGVAAFAVDFYTGAIYLPVEEDFPPPSPTPSQFGPPPGSVMYGYPEQAPPPGTGLENLPSPPPDISPAFGPPHQGNVSPRLHAPTNPAPIGSGTMPPPPRLGLKRVDVPREQLRPQQLEQVVSAELGRPISLDDQQARVSVLPRLEVFKQQERRHREDRRFGYAVRAFFKQFQNA